MRIRELAFTVYFLDWVILEILFWALYFVTISWFFFLCFFFPVIWELQDKLTYFVIQFLLHTHWSCKIYIELQLPCLTYPNYILWVTLWLFISLAICSPVMWVHSKVHFEICLNSECNCACMHFADQILIYENAIGAISSLVLSACLIVMIHCSTSQILWWPITFCYYKF